LKKAWMLEAAIEEKLEKLHQEMFEFDFKFVFAENDEEAESDVYEEPIST
jgi:hypothetical protein